MTQSREGGSGQRLIRLSSQASSVTLVTTCHKTQNRPAGDGTDDRDGPLANRTKAPLQQPTRADAEQAYTAFPDLS
jgi:hypothetical protein